MATLSHLLLFDPDSSGLETLTYVFEKEGIAVSGFGDPTKLREQLPGATSWLVLVALREPEQICLDLIREISSNPRTRHMACLALGPARSRAAAVHAGAFGCLASPLFVRDVYDNCQLIAAATLPGTRPSAETEVQIKLTEIGGVYYLVRALAASARSAAVDIQRGSRRGELRFIDGNLSSVQLGGLSGLAALHQLLLWEEADLRLKFRNVVRRGSQLSLTNDEVTEQCDRFMRDFAHEAREMGTARTVYRPSDRKVQPTAALPSEVVPLLRMFDGTRDLSRIVDESPFRTFDTLRIARQFIGAGAVVTDPPFTPPPADTSIPGGRAALDAWFERKDVSPAMSTTVALGAGARPALGAATVVPRAGSSPFTKVAARTTTTSGEMGGEPPAIPLTRPKERKSRPNTAKDHTAAAVSAPVQAGELGQWSEARRSGEAAAVEQRADDVKTAEMTAAQLKSAVLQTAGPEVGGAKPGELKTTAGAVQTIGVMTAATSGETKSGEARPGEAGGERATRASGAVARGEIHVTPVAPRASEPAPRSDAPSVLVEIDASAAAPPPAVSVAMEAAEARARRPGDEMSGPATPPPAGAPVRPLSLVADATTEATPPPLPRRATPPPLPRLATPPPRVRGSTPPPRALTPAPLAGRSVTQPMVMRSGGPKPLPAASPAARALPDDTRATPRPLVDPITPPPTPKAGTDAVPAAATSAPPTAAAAPPPTAPPPAAGAGTGTRKGGVPGHHRSRTPSNGFSAMEADFFNREAELYRHDSPDTFDDLDNANSPEPNTPGFPPGKRRPAR